MMKTKYPYVYVSILFFISYSSFSQDLPSIQTDRPDQTESPFITPKGYFQLENGFVYEKKNTNSEEIIAPTVLVRYGINPNLELRFITEYAIKTVDFRKSRGINPVLIGFKAKLMEEKGIIPTTSFIGHIMIPKAASASLKQQYYTPDFRFTMQHTLSDKQVLAYNLGAEWSDGSAEPTFVYTLTSGYSITEKLGGYMELYGFIPQMEKPDHRFGTGLTYLFNPNHQIDLSGGLGLSKISPDYYVSVGYSFRFKV